MEGGSVPAHAVAVQRAVRKAEIVRRAPGVEESALIAAHAARPFACPMCPTVRAAGPVPPTRDRAGRRTRAGEANLGGAARVFKADG